MALRPVHSADVTAIVSLWNRQLVYEPISEAMFRSHVLEDPNFEAEGHLVSERDGAVDGFVSAICRAGPLGRDGKGRPGDANKGYVRDLLGVSEIVWTELLDAAFQFLHERGKSHILTGEYTGHYITPGVDSRYESLCEFLRTRFDKESTLEDMEADLTGNLPNDFQRQAEQRATAYGVVVERYVPSMLPAMKRFAQDLGIAQWFPPGWEQGYFDERTAFVATRRGEIVGWTDYRPDGGSVSLGPMGVAPDHRHHGVGTCLVLACMREGVRLGLSRIWAGWTNTPFYVPSGWRVFRQYVVFESHLA